MGKALTLLLLLAVDGHAGLSRTGPNLQFSLSHVGLTMPIRTEFKCILLGSATSIFHLVPVPISPSTEGHLCVTFPRPSGPNTGPSLSPQLLFPALSFVERGLRNEGRVPYPLPVSPLACPYCLQDSQETLLPHSAPFPASTHYTPQVFQ